MTITDRITEAETHWRARQEATAQVLQAVGQSREAMDAALAHSAQVSLDASRIAGVASATSRWAPVLGLHGALAELGPELDPQHRDTLFRILVATAAATDRAAALLGQEGHPAAPEHRQAAESIRDLARHLHWERAVGLLSL